MSFQRTRLVDRPQAVPPQSYGVTPVVAVGPALPADVAIPLRADEGVWLAFEAVGSPTAVRVAVGLDVLVDAVSGAAWSEHLGLDPQNYLVVPPQRALDGVQASPAAARPFGGPSEGGQLTLIVLAIPPIGALESARTRDDSLPQPLRQRAPTRPGAAPDAFLPQRISPDPHGIAAWDLDRAERVRIAVLPPDEFTRVTGLPSPPRIVDSQGFSGRRLP